MEVEEPRLDNPPAMMTFDEVSMERSKNFVKALQELKNLRPQLYSAAEYCEKSYLHSEQKQMVLDNLKDYTVRALVNAVDHLGTVAYKLTDLLEQQTLEVSAIELRLSSLDQQLLTCQTYMDKEGLKQQQFVAVIPRHHKHYILPNTVNKKVHFSPRIQTDARQNHIHSRPRVHPTDTPASKTLSWHLASETKSTLKGVPRSSSLTSEDPRDSGKNSAVFNLMDAEDNKKNVQVPSGWPASNAAMQALGGMQRDFSLGDSKTLAGAGFRSFDSGAANNKQHREIVRSKSMLSAFFVKQKTSKLKTSPVA